MDIPPARQQSALAYDSARGVTVLFGGTDLTGTVFLQDTWEWDGTDWTPASPAVSPPARYSHAMDYDQAAGVTLLFSGAGAALAVLDDTWGWDGTAWRPVSTPTTPAPRWGFAMVYDSVHSTSVLFGGINAIDYFDLNDTWTWSAQGE